MRAFPGLMVVLSLAMSDVALALDPARTPPLTSHEVTTNRIILQGGDSTGDISKMSVVPDAAAPMTSLSGILANKANAKRPVFTGVSEFYDQGRNGTNDNAPSLAIIASESVSYPDPNVTNYGLIVDRTMLPGGTNDRMAASFVQKCQATAEGRSCVGSNSISVAGGKAIGGYTGANDIVKLPPGLPGPAGAAVGLEVNTHTHSPVKIRNGIRIADEFIFDTDVPTTRGTIEDAGIAMVTSDFRNKGGLGFRVGIQFGEADQGYAKNWPVIAGGTIIQMNNPNVRVAYGIDMKGSTSGFDNGAIVLPIKSRNNGIYWGNNHQGGSIQSTATASGPIQTFTDNGASFDTTTGGSLLQLSNSGAVTVPGVMVVNGTASVGNLVRNGAAFYADVTKLSPASGATITMTGAYTKLVLDPVGTLKALTVLFPANPVNGQVVEVSSTQTITALTLNGQGKPIANAVTTLGSGPLGKVSYTYVASAGAWYP